MLVDPNRLFQTCQDRVTIVYTTSFQLVPGTGISTYRYTVVGERKRGALKMNWVSRLPPIRILWTGIPIRSSSQRPDLTKYNKLTTATLSNQESKVVDEALCTTG
jgi:hypothetical protein